MLCILMILLGVTTSYWEERDFSDCEFRGAGISRDGGVILSYNIDSIFETKDMYIWDIFPTGDGIYIATGQEGRIYRICDGKGELFFDSGEKNVLTLAEYKGYIYAGTSPEGKIYRIDKKGRGEVILDSDEEFIWDIAITANGEIICGTGGNGLVLGIENGCVDTLLETGRANASRVVLIDKDVYVGTGNGGLLFIIPKGGQPKGIYDGGSGEVSGIVKMGDILYFSHCLDTTTVIKRVRNDGLTEDIVTIPGMAKGIVEYKDVLLCASEKRIYRIYDDGKFDVIYEFPTSVSSMGRDGYLGLSKFVSVYRLSERPPEQGIVESNSYDAGGVSKWGRLTYEGKGKVVFETRSGNTENPDVTWDEWKKTAKNGEIRSSPNRFIRWRAKIGNNLSRIKCVQVAYLPLNQKPIVGKIKLELESGVLTFSGSDPDGDSLSFNIYYRELGEEWIELKKEVSDTTVNVDRDAFPDGSYEFKVKATDAPSNPPDYALSSYKLSDVYRIDNTPPHIKIEIRENTAIVVVGDDMSEIASFEYSENASKFISVFPVDGIFDEKKERFEITLKDDTRDLVVRAKDRADNFSLQKWTR
ncbi:hypothetical protein CH333_04595 [candidate division WOR-3 bacterium JGI_Cruoil_03_44_89]|uniref:Fibronectin type-III domain-containing protein n=1 Tax=candidate division WOR-3 bacterium JGI_Cruoil_03_44_89 TaxID=1973748 RepID=A0A235BU62_UNCW3|nr:MAG: hypothetical protein CH333_04595 [candidate division WOR-3 bacterium JGI_Cruoil_03_44_89]